MMSAIFYLLILTSMTFVAQGEITNPYNGTDWFKHIRLFIDKILPDNPPVLDTLIELLKNKSSSKIDAKELAKEITETEGVVVGFFAFGLLVALLMPLICCGCMCKACCCKTKPASERSHTARNCLSCFSLLFILAALPGIIYVFYSSQHLNDISKNIVNRVNSSIDEVADYLNETKSNVNDLTGTQFDKMKTKINNEFDNITHSLGKLLQSRFDSNLDANLFLNNLKESIEVMKVTPKKLEQLNVYINKQPPETDFQKLTKAAAKYKAELDEICKKDATTCSNALNEAIKRLPSEDIKQIQFNELKQFVSTKFEGILKDGQTEYNAIPEKVKDSSATVAANVKTHLDDLGGDLSDLDHKIDNMTAYIDVARSNITSVITDNDEYTEQGTKYSTYFTLGTASYIALIWVIFAFGLCLGICFHQKKVIPDDRTCGSNTGGCLLIVAVAIMLCTSTIFWLISTILFPVGAHGEKYLCSPMYDEPDFGLFKEIACKFDIDVSGTGISSFIPNVTNDNVVDKVFDVLRDCKENTPAYRAFHLESIINIDDLLDINKHFNIEQEVNNLNKDIKISTDVVKKIFNGDLSAELDKAKSAVDKIDLTEVKKAANLESTINNITSYKILPESENLKTIEGIITKEKDNLTDISATVELVENLKIKLEEIKVQLDNGIKKADEATMNSIISESVGDFGKQLFGYAQEYANHTADVIRTQLGCRPVYSLFDNVRGLVCKDLIDPLNGFWFGLGSTLFFFLPLSCVACSLSRHFRRLKSDDYYR